MHKYYGVANEYFLALLQQEKNVVLGQNCHSQNFWNINYGIMLCDVLKVYLYSTIVLLFLPKKQCFEFISSGYFFHERMGKKKDKLCTHDDIPLIIVTSLEVDMCFNIAWHCVNPRTIYRHHPGPISFWCALAWCCGKQCMSYMTWLCFFYFFVFPLIQIHLYQYHLKMC